jgi:hypothetical protein
MSQNSPLVSQSGPSEWGGAAHVDHVLSKPPKLRELNAALVQVLQAAQS